MDPEVSRQVRPGLGPIARTDLCTSEKSRRHSPKSRTHASAEGATFVGLSLVGSAEAACAPNGSLRGLPRTHRLRDRPPTPGGAAGITWPEHVGHLYCWR